MIKSIVVLGGGSAGLLAALSLRAKLPALQVRLICSRAMGIIGVGEGSIVDLPNHLHGHLRLDPADFHRAVQPTYKLGVRFLWGPREEFFYSFSNPVSACIKGMSRPAGMGCYEDFADLDLNTALMRRGLAFASAVQTPGVPDLRNNVAYHLENEPFVAWLEKHAAARGVAFTDAKLERVETGPDGVAALHLDSGERVTADLFVDASGFRSELLGGALEEPFVSYQDALFCDRALSGGWERGADPIQPYTTAETMQSGWSWRIDHPHRINRGYVYSSAFISDNEAETEFRRKNPQVSHVRRVDFRSGRYRRAWVKNVCAIGNAAGFVEPLEATALNIISVECRMLAAVLTETHRRPGPAMVASFNRIMNHQWDEIRDFLAIHYRFNTRVDSPFWKHCLEHTALHGAEQIVEFYRENGPSLLTQAELLPPALSIFQLDGFYTLLLGQNVPHAAPPLSGPDQITWQRHRKNIAAHATKGLTMEQSLALIQSPHWQWTPGFYNI